MIRTILALLLVWGLPCLTVSAQERSLLDYNEVAMGKCADGSKLMFHYIPVEGELKNVAFVSTLPYMIISDGKGNHLYHTKTLDYVGELKYGNKRLAQINSDGYLAYSTGGLFSFGYGKPTFYDFKNNKIWSSKNEVLVADRHNNVVVCTQDRKGEDLIAYNMSTGKELWRQKIAYDKHYPWAHFYIDNVDKRFYYLMGNSLVRLDILTGDTLCHDFTAGVKEPLKSVFSFVKRRKIVGSQFLDDLIYSDVPGNSLTGTHSNILFSGDSLYVADANNIYCLDKRLKTLWKVAMPEGLGASSHITLIGGKLYVQNFGVAFQRGLVGRCGKPFVAAYDGKDGRQLSLDIPHIEKKITGGAYAGGRAYWQADKDLYYTDEGDSTVRKIDWRPNTPNAPDEYHADYAIQDTVGVVRDGRLLYVVTGREQVVMEVYGRDVNLVRADGTCDLLPSGAVYLNKAGNVYWTNNGNDHYNHFVIVDPATRKVRYAFYINGTVRQDDAGNIYVSTKQGVGFHQAGT